MQVANITCVVFGAMSVGLLYLVVHGLMSLMLGLFDFSSLFENDGLEISRMAAIARVFSSAGLPFFERLEWHPTARFY